MAREKVLSGYTTASAPAVITVYHHQLKDLVVCPSERGIVSYVSGRLIVSHDIRKSYKAPSPLANLDFEPNCLSSGCGLIVAGGSLAELFIGAMPASPTDSAPQLLWSQTQQLKYPASINNSLLVTNSNFIPSYSPASCLAIGESPAANLEPRLFVSNNDYTVKVFTVAMGSGIQGERLTQTGELALKTPVNHTSISPDGRTLLAVGDTNEIFLQHITAGDEVSFQKISTYNAGSDANFSTAWSSDGRKFAVACQDGQVTVWDTRSSKPLSIFRCGRPVTSTRRTERAANLRSTIDRMLATATTASTTTSTGEYTYPIDDLMNYRTRVEELLRESNTAPGLAREPRLEAFLRNVRTRRQSDADLNPDTAIGSQWNDAMNDLGAISAGQPEITARRRRYTETGTSTISNPVSNAPASGEAVILADLQRIRNSIRGNVEELSDEGSGREGDESRGPLYTFDERMRLLTAGQAPDGASFQRQPRYTASRQRASLNYTPPTAGSPSITTAATGSLSTTGTTSTRRPHAVRTFDELLTNVITRSYVHMPPSALIRSWPDRHQTVVAYGEPGRGSASWMGITERQLGESSNSGARVMEEQRNAARALKFSPPGRTNGARDLLVFTEVGRQLAKRSSTHAESPDSCHRTQLASTLLTLRLSMIIRSSRSQISMRTPGAARIEPRLDNDWIGIVTMKSSSNPDNHLQPGILV
ncbi:hypothetical protein FRB94_000341 [Tulasnella sp. JGI-2019a]|nr:hypothetical protein FRB94_000341 [Tulasnella sp. JGI-2019a]